MTVSQDPTGYMFAICWPTLIFDPLQDRWYWYSIINHMHLFAFFRMVPNVFAKNITISIPPSPSDTTLWFPGRKDMQGSFPDDRIAHANVQHPVPEGPTSCHHKRQWCPMGYQPNMKPFLAAEKIHVISLRSKVKGVYLPLLNLQSSRIKQIRKPASTSANASTNA